MAAGPGLAPGQGHQEEGQRQVAVVAERVVEVAVEAMEVGEQEPVQEVEIMVETVGEVEMVMEEEEEEMALEGEEVAMGTEGEGAEMEAETET